MEHLIAVTVHAVAAAIALLTGMITLRGGRWFTLHRIAVLVMSLSLPISITLGWQNLDSATKVLFPALFVLSLVMVARTEAARRSTPGGPAFIDHVGFTLIALVTGLVTVLVLRAGAGPVGIVAASIAIPLAGRRLIARTPKGSMPATISSEERSTAPEKGSAGDTAPRAR